MTFFRGFLFSWRLKLPSPPPAFCMFIITLKVSQVLSNPVEFLSLTSSLQSKLDYTPVILGVDSYQSIFLSFFFLFSFLFSGITFSNKKGHIGSVF